MDAHHVVLLAGALSFVSGYTVSTVPLLRAGLGFKEALCTVLAADTLSILTMVIVDNIIMLLILWCCWIKQFAFGYWGWRAVSFSLAFLAAPAH